MKTTQKATGVWAFMACGVLLLTGLTACSTIDAVKPDVGNETIAYSTGRCYGGRCAIFSLEVAPSGHVTFAGGGNTVVFGKKEREAGVKAYRAVASALAAYRPADGTTEKTVCEIIASDDSDYIITWTKTDGTRTVLNHYKGCLSPRGEALNKVMDSIPAELGVARWAKHK